MIKISFVVPVYNVEQYLERCLDSILGSSLTEEQYEVIIVNDGSTDNSAVIGQRYCDSYPNISMVTQENQGLSAARNTGIEHAKGDYLWFPDSDDYFDSTKLKVAYETLMKNPNLDVMVTCCNVIEGDTSRKSDYYPQFIGKTITGKEAILSGYEPSAVWVILYRKAFLKENSLSFYFGISHQDVEFNLRMMALAQNVLFTDIVTYNYIKRLGSISVPKNREKTYFNYHCDLLVAESFAKFSQTLDDKVLANNILRRSNSLLAGILISTKKSSNPFIDREFKEQLLAEMEEHGCFPLHGPFRSFKMTLYSKLLNIRSYILS